MDDHSNLITFCDNLDSLSQTLRDSISEVTEVNFVGDVLDQVGNISADETLNDEQDADKTVKICPVCKKDFSTDSNIRRHIRQSHKNFDVSAVYPPDPNRNEICPLCFRRFVTVDCVRKHIEKHHSLYNVDELCPLPPSISNVQQFVSSCPICDLQYTSQHCLDKHLQEVHMVGSSQGQNFLNCLQVGTSTNGLIFKAVPGNSKSQNTKVENNDDVDDDDEDDDDDGSGTISDSEALDNSTEVAADSNLRKRKSSSGIWGLKKNKRPKSENAENISNSLRCSVCDKVFIRKQHLVRHMNYTHELQLGRKGKKLSVTCYLCGLTFKRRGAALMLKKHINSVHMIKTVKSQPKKKFIRRGSTACPVCFRNCMNLRLLHKHITETHPELGIEDPLTMIFNNEEEFITWKEEEELRTTSAYLKRRRLKDDNKAEFETQVFLCSRSGNPRSSILDSGSSGIERSSKIGVTCPAYMKAVYGPEGVTVTYVSTHVGHVSDVQHLPLSRKEKMYVCELLVEHDMSNDAVLQRILEFLPTAPMTRLHYISRSDLRNIVRTNIWWQTLRNKAEGELGTNAKKAWTSYCVAGGLASLPGGKNISAETGKRIYVKRAGPKGPKAKVKQIIQVKRELLPKPESSVAFGNSSLVFQTSTDVTKATKPQTVTAKAEKTTSQSQDTTEFKPVGRALRPKTAMPSLDLGSATILVGPAPSSVVPVVSSMPQPIVISPIPSSLATSESALPINIKSERSAGSSKPVKYPPAAKPLTIKPSKVTCILSVGGKQKATTIVIPAASDSKQPLLPKPSNNGSVTKAYTASGYSYTSNPISISPTKPNERVLLPKPASTIYPSTSAVGLDSRSCITLPYLTSFVSIQIIPTTLTAAPVQVVKPPPEPEKPPEKPPPKKVDPRYENYNPIMVTSSTNKYMVNRWKVEKPDYKAVAARLVAAAAGIKIDPPKPVLNFVKTPNKRGRKKKVKEPATTESINTSIPVDCSLISVGNLVETGQVCLGENLDEFGQVSQSEEEQAQSQINWLEQAFCPTVQSVLPVNSLSLASVADSLSSNLLQL